MRTTLDIADDVLQAAKELAAARKSTTGEVISELTRKGLTARAGRTESRNGVPVISSRGEVISLKPIRR